MSKFCTVWSSVLKISTSLFSILSCIFFSLEYVISFIVIAVAGLLIACFGFKSLSFKKLWYEILAHTMFFIFLVLIVRFDNKDPKDLFD